MSIIQSLINEGVCILYHDYRSRSFKDWSGNGNDGVPTSTVWAGDGLRFPVAASKVTVSHNTGLNLTAATLVAFGDWDVQTGAQMLFYKRDADGTSYQFYIDPSHLRLADGTDNRYKTTNVLGKKYIAVNFTNGATPEVFVDGISGGSMDGAVTVPEDDADLTIGSSNPATNKVESTYKAALVINRVLTDTEHAQLFAELEAMEWNTKPYSKALLPEGVELLADGDMEEADTTSWFSFSGTTLTKDTTAPHSGLQNLRVARDGINYPAARQTILTTGKTYRITGWFNGDSNAYPRIGNNAVNKSIVDGTTSTSWQFFDEVFVALGETICLAAMTATGTEYVGFDDVSIKEVDPNGNEVQYKTDYGVNESVANVTSGELENSGWEVENGTGKIVTSTINGTNVKVAESQDANLRLALSIDDFTSSTEAAYGTWKFWVKKVADGGIFRLILGDVKGAYDATGQDGYLFQLDASEKLDLLRIDNGDVTRIDRTADAQVTVGQWAEIKITRTPAGIWNVGVDGTDGIISNQTDATHTTINWIVFELDNFDQLAIASPNGDYSFTKKTFA